MEANFNELSMTPRSMSVLVNVDLRYGRHTQTDNLLALGQKEASVALTNFMIFNDNSSLAIDYLTFMFTNTSTI